MGIRKLHHQNNEQVARLKGNICPNNPGKQKIIATYPGTLITENIQRNIILRVESGIGNYERNGFWTEKPGLGWALDHSIN